MPVHTWTHSSSTETGCPPESMAHFPLDDVESGVKKEDQVECREREFTFVLEPAIDF